MKVFKTMPGFEGVAAGQTATVRLPLGLTYESILLTYSGATLAQLNEARIVANGRTLQRWVELSKLDTINKFHGRAAASGVIVLDFNRFNLRTRAGEEFTALGTGVRAPEGGVELSTLALEIDIDAAAVGSALSAAAIQSAPRPLGLIKNVREFTYSPAAAGEYEITDLPKGHLFNALHFHHGGNMSALRIERDGYTLFDRTVAENSLIQSDGKRTPQTNVFTFDPTELGNGAESLITAGVQDLRFILTMTGAASVGVTLESLAPFSR